jgi:mRNA-degrading endonuclease toxin of MazEF toxin-antitoxin module
MVDVAALVTVDKDDLAELIGQVPDHLMQDADRELRQVLGM